MDLAVYYSAHVIVMEKLDLKGSKHGSKKQRRYLSRYFKKIG